MEEDQKTIELLTYIATKQFNLTEEEAKAIIVSEEGKLKDDAADVLLEKDKARIAKLKSERETKYNEGYQTAEKKFKSHAEEVFKKKTGYNGTEDNFESMYDAWFEKTKVELGKKKEITDDDIKRTSLFIDLETKSVPKADYEKLQSDFDQFKLGQQRQSTMGLVMDRAWGVVAAKNPILSENQTVADNRKKDFLNKFGSYDYDIQDEKIVILKEGKRLEDAHGNLKQFDTFVMELAEMNFDFRAQEEVGNTGNKNKPGGVVVVTEKPRTQAEYFAALDKYNSNSEEDAKKRIALKKFYFENKQD